MHASISIPHRSPQSPPKKPQSLPLRLLPRLERLQYCHLPLQRLQPLPRRRVHLAGVVAQLGVEVLAVRRRGHGGAEDGFHEEGVVWFERVSVGGTEGGGELIGGVEEVGADALGGEVEAAGGVLV